jgi:hypothetical protein
MFVVVISIRTSVGRSMTASGTFWTWMSRGLDDGVGNLLDLDVPGTVIDDGFHGVPPGETDLYRFEPRLPRG